MFGLRLNSAAAYTHTAATYYDSIFPNMGDCVGSVLGCVLLTSYLGLCINFYM
jgi:hypothetical protein